jgi:GTP diphosphokinase / guanosine-3',5'-bis(diphosphate) 3'-diphosphatase
MSNLETLKEQIRTRVQARSDVLALDHAFELAQAAHEHQIRDEGTPYILHPLRAALVLVNEFHVYDLHALILAVLHDVPEKSRGKSSKGKLEAIRKQFGGRTANELRILSSKRGATREERDANYIRSIREAPTHVRLVKLADRLDNVRSLPHNPDLQKRVRYIRETERDFVPLARETDVVAYEALLHALDDAKQSVEKPTKMLRS